MMDMSIYMDTTSSDQSHIKNNISEHICHSDSCTDAWFNWGALYLKHALLLHSANALLDTAKKKKNPFQCWMNSVLWVLKKHKGGVT